MKTYLLLIFALFIVSSLQAQNAIKNVIVETYYISDVNDATDTTAGNYLEPGSKTYRVFIEMEPGFKLTKIYGDKNHPLIFKSTSTFFNNKDYGASFGKDISFASLKHNTVALDTWITLGQVTKAGVNTYFGVLKSQDSSSSAIGGANNDGGSAEIAGGLLINDTHLAGIPLTTADGIDTMSIVPINWVNSGIVDLITGNDSSIFGSIITGSEFVSTNASIQNSGVMGINPNNNLVLVAQLTTKGDIFFKLNVEIADSNGTSFKYVAEGNDTAGVKNCPYLKFPPDSGCIDPNYFEFSTKYIRNDNDSCKTLIVYGCMDPNACNFDADANFNLPSLCCYPGNCSGRDLGLVCPDMASQPISVAAFPNPVNDDLTIQVSTIDDKETQYVILNSFGNIVLKKDIGMVSGTFSDNIAVSGYEPGIYLIRVIAGDSGASMLFIKN